jgi:hypothetical protein
VKFKNMYTNVYIKSDRSFIRSALDMLPSQEDLDKAQQARQSQGQQQQQPAASSGSGSQGSTADASQLSSDIFKSAFGSMGNTAGQTVNAIGNMKPPSAPGFDGRVTTLEDAMKAAGGF